MGLGNASIVICSIGASEKEVFDVTGPCRIDYRATKNLIDAGKEIFCMWPYGSYQETKLTIFSSCVFSIPYMVISDMGGGKFVV